MPMKRMAILLCVIFFSVNTLAENKLKDKYKNYVFDPEYGRNVSNESWGLYQHGYKQYLLDLQAPRTLLSLDFELNKTLFIQVKTTDSYGFMKRSDEVYKKTGRRELSSWDGVMVYDDSSNKLLLKERSLLPVGRGGYDYYGCIDEKPLYKANIIGDIEKDELFVITGAGHHTDNMRGAGARDHLMLHVYGGEQYNKLFEVMLLAVNYRPWNPDNPPKDYYFPKSEFSKAKVKIEGEAGEGRKFHSKLFFQDFNENGKMDVLIWQAEHKSRKIDPMNKPGFDLIRNEFIWYEESANSSGLDKKTITSEQAKMWLKDKSLTWKNGWPNKSFCTGGKKVLPIMVGVDDPELN